MTDRSTSSWVLIVVAIIGAVGAIGAAILAPRFEVNQTPTPAFSQSCIIPSLERLEQGAAETQLANLGLQSVKSTEYNTTIDAGFVLSQEPESGRQLTPCAGEVIITVSLGPVPPKSIEEYPQSCLDILEHSQNSEDGHYTIDVDGSSNSIKPFEVYCDMNRHGGGWTLVAYHADGIKAYEIDKVTLSGYGIVPSNKWQELRDKMAVGMMFVDENNRTSLISLEKLNSGNCQRFQEIDTLALSQNSTQSIWHHEESGCNSTGQDYSIINIKQYPDKNHKFSGAALYQLSRIKFDVWPYGANMSYDEQNELYYFIK